MNRSNQKSIYILLFSLVFLTLIFQCKNSSSSDKAELSFENAWIRIVPPASRITGGYIKILNSSTEDRFISASSNISDSVEIHSMIEKEGMMMMRKLENGIQLKSQEISELRPGGNHLMLIGLKKDLNVNDSVEIELVFEKQGKKVVSFQVKNASEMNP